MKTTIKVSSEGCVTINDVPMGHIARLLFEKRRDVVEWWNGYLRGRNHSGSE